MVGAVQDRLCAGRGLCRTGAAERDEFPHQEKKASVGSDVRKSTSTFFVSAFFPLYYHCARTLQGLYEDFTRTLQGLYKYFTRTVQGL
jgi:hypothetical protein